MTQFQLWRYRIYTCIHHLTNIHVEPRYMHNISCYMHVGSNVMLSMLRSQQKDLRWKHSQLLYNPNYFSFFYYNLPLKLEPKTLNQFEGFHLRLINNKPHGSQISLDFLYFGNIGRTQFKEVMRSSWVLMIFWSCTTSQRLLFTCMKSHDHENLRAIRTIQRQYCGKS